MRSHFRRAFSLITIALLLSLVPGPRQAAALSTAGGPAAPAPSTLLPIPPPPHQKPQRPNVSGRIDLPFPIEDGSIRVHVQPGRTIEQLIAKWGLLGPATHWNTPPFDEYDVRSGLDRSFKVRVPVGTERTWTTKLAAQPADFDYVGPLWREPVKAAFYPNDPKFCCSHQQDNLIAIGMPVAWDRTVSFSGVVVAVIDSGLRGSHEDAGCWKQTTGYDAFTQTTVAPCAMTDTGAYGGHGSQVTSIAVGDTNNGLGVAGTGFNSAIKPIKFIASDGVTTGPSRADPIRWARLNGAHVINMSYEFSLYDNDERLAIQDAWTVGITPVTAAGNENASPPGYPCAWLYIICVGGTDNAGNKWSQSNYGSSWVDVAAPAINIYGMGSGSNSNYIFGSGTSYAAPQVAGIMALLRSIGKTNNDQWLALCNTAFANSWTLCGFVNAGAALNY
ncbi:MAG TPA: S8 family serine peptidase [Candidatus Limnocylindria bacterium]